MHMRAAATKHAQEPKKKKMSLLLSLCHAGTGEGDVEDAEKLLQPYLKKYPKVRQT